MPRQKSVWTQFLQDDKKLCIAHFNAKVCAEMLLLKSISLLIHWAKNEMKLSSFCHSILTYFKMKEDNRLEIFLRNTPVQQNIYCLFIYLTIIHIEQLFDKNFPHTWITVHKVCKIEIFINNKYWDERLAKRHILPYLITVLCFCIDWDKRFLIMKTAWK